MISKDAIHKYIWRSFLVIAVIVGTVSMFITVSPQDTKDMAGHVEKACRERLARLDKYGESLLKEPKSSEDWPDLSAFPDDMVIYRYVADTLHSWYNLFSVTNDSIGEKSVFQRICTPRYSISSPLEEAGNIPTYMNLGNNWYIVKALQRGKVKIVEGLLIKRPPNGRNTGGHISGHINTHIHVHGKFDTVPLAEEGGDPVVLDGTAVFKVVAAKNASAEETNRIVFLLRWMASLLAITGIVLMLSFRRTPRRFIVTACVILITTVALRIWESNLDEFSEFFSPTLYAHDGLLDSFGALVTFNTAIFLICLCMFLCRDLIIRMACRSRKHQVIFCISCSIATLLIILYAAHTFASLIRNSSIALDLTRLWNLNIYTVLAYLSYSLLLVCCLILIECIVESAGRIRSEKRTVLSAKGIFCFALASALFLSIIYAALSFDKEEQRVTGWSNRLAVDRDLGLELELRSMEDIIASDPTICALALMEGTEHLIACRLEDIFPSHWTSNFDIRVSLHDVSNLRDKVGELLRNGSPIASDSNFLIYKLSSFDNAYKGVFHYFDRDFQGKAVILDIIPRYDRQIEDTPATPLSSISRVQLPPPYSWGRYHNGKLSSFHGTFAYPTILDHGFVKNDKSNFSNDGYRHFVRIISDDEVIIISRKEKSFLIYGLAYSYIVLLLFLVGLFFRQKEDKEEGHSYFSNKMRRLIITSLSATLVTMTLVSVLFVYRRNSNSLLRELSSRISTVQIMLDGACRSMTDTDDLNTENFIERLGEIAETAKSDINVFSPSGRLIMSSSPRAENMVQSCRMDPVAFKNIIFGHQRYYIRKSLEAGNRAHRMYAPIFNGEGVMMAIVSVPYSRRDYDFTRDAIIHSALIISLFLILLLTTMIIASSMIKSIFHPLLMMSQKMKGTDTSALEKIAYEGNDEISSLVSSYNTMVSDLKESTARLAASERDKAWSEMARQVAHEIKNPLTPIKLEIQRLIRLKEKGDSQWEQKFDDVSKIVLDHIDILSQTANEFSTFAKLYSQESSSIDLDVILREEISLFESQEAEITYLGTHGAVVEGPKPQLVRVFVNLLTNACQATADVENPRVFVSLRRSMSQRKGWDIVFEDNGPGVSKENESKLFSPNFTTKSNGTGLGLAICRSIIDRAGGEISYSRSFVLGGACFTVRLFDDPSAV